MIVLRRRTELVTLRVQQPGQSVQASRAIQPVHLALAGVRAVALPLGAVQLLNVYTQHNAAAGSEGGGYTARGVVLNEALNVNLNASGWFYLALPVGSGLPFNLLVGGLPVAMDDRGLFQIAEEPATWYRVYRYNVGAAVVPVALTVQPATGFNQTNWGRLVASHRGRSATLEMRRMDLGVSPELFFLRDDNTPGAPMLPLGWSVSGVGDSVQICYRDDVSKNFGSWLDYEVLVELIWVLRHPAVDLLSARERSNVYRWFLNLNRDGLPVENLNELVKRIPDERAWMQ